MHKRMKELGLVDHLPDKLWPSASAVREVATKAAALAKKGVKGAFVVAELRKSVVICV